jgi:hypothetical protein
MFKHVYAANQFPQSVLTKSLAFAKLRQLVLKAVDPVEK